MLQLQEALVNRGRTKIVKFNAWQYDADDALWSAFINEFDAELNRRLGWTEKIVARCRLVALRAYLAGSIET